MNEFSLEHSNSSLLNLNCSLATDLTDFLSENNQKYDNTEIINSEKGVHPQQNRQFEQLDSDNSFDFLISDNDFAEDASEFIEVNSDEVFNSELKLSSIDSYICLKCHNRFKNLFQYSFHNKGCYENQNYSCMECNYQNASIDNLHYHIQKHLICHLNCPTCNTLFNNSRLFITHLKIHTIEVENELEELIYGNSDDDRNFTVEKVVFNRSTINIKLPIHNNNYKCHYCNFKMANKFRLFIHESSHKLKNC